ncbi:phospholipid/cholesterol/gamma-HCH transport system substrate-binding protein [Micromonospora pattaloongensis]|uniref:Phospholipid/cholesterol/gamma-HCH transport system substrate-binding protein n=1 Tax=Micromonospora pattaloongensis TaxID=405436 RepID=A0A1H3RTZ1_9ACTN|nr:MCE family protein [Micromonospora pattaloongensis]SDZ29122.1 phospholipid/cholesterol/gamma-HCH transport system substrate-binding protein [Micromonospora pattaloongensis]
MIGRTAKAQVVLFLVVSLLGVSYVAVRYVGLGERLLGGGLRVHVELAHAGGLFPNAPVTYRGVPVGRVDAVRLRGDGVRAELRLQRGTRVPTDLWAVVSQRSAVGEQYLDLRPERDAGPYLRDGAVIPRERTGVPLPPETLLANLDALVRSVDADDLTVLITELGTAFEGNEAALGRILDAGDALLAEASATLPETLALIRDGRTVLATQAESADALRRWADGLARLAETVRASDPDLRRLLTAGPPAGRELVALLRGLDPAIGTLVGNLVTVNGIAARRLPGIEQMLVVYPMAVAGGFTVTPGDGTVHLGLVVNAGDPPACVNDGAGGCRSGQPGVRGAGNAPRPGADGPRPAPAPADPAPPALAGFDPATGLVLGPDGRPLQFGGTGGQARLAGDQSWKQLLLAGVTP